MKIDYDPTFKNVHGVHIGVVVALLFLGYIAFFRGGVASPFGGPRELNGTGANAYISTRSIEGWEAIQYHSLGASSGILTGESD